MAPRRQDFAVDRSSRPRFGPLRYHGVRWLLLVFVAVVTYAMFPAPAAGPGQVPAIGAIAPRDVIAPVPFMVPKSPEQLEREGDALARTVRPVYRFSATAYDSAVGAVQGFFRALEAAAPTDPEAVQRAAAGSAVRLAEADAAVLADPDARRAIADLVTAVLGGALSRGVADAGVIRGEPSRMLLLQRADEETLTARDSIRTFADLVEMADRAGQRLGSEDAARTVRRLVAAFYRPTIVLDAELTERRRQQLRQSVDSVRYTVRAGERLATSDQVVTDEAHAKLTALAQELEDQEIENVALRTAFGTILFNIVVLTPFWLLLALYRRETYADLRHMMFFALLFAGVVLLSAAVHGLFDDRPELLPIPLAAMLITMLFNGRIALMAVMSLSILLGGQWALRETPTLFFGLVAGVAAAVGMRAIRRRQALYLTVGVLTAAYALGSLTAGLMLGWPAEEIIDSGLAGLVTAFISAALALLLLPVAEATTHITTNLTLLELSDFRRPLLRRLALEAPGTWAHSIAMANLCEAACNAIGANGLLARVGCYYHDVGKLKRPQYFVENQTGGSNPHDKLKPQQSAQIIRNHVKDGLELADEAGLPPTVRAFIPEHHGTSDIKYFLHRARGRDPGAEIDPGDFVYPGPRPRSAETAIAMLADAAEAAVRVLDEPTPEAVRGAIDQLANQRLAAGQLDEAPLTLRDIERVKQEFVRVLSGIHHTRIEYPRAGGGITSEFTGAR